MKRWESLTDGYIRECELRGLAPATIYHRRSELEKFGVWLRRRRPRPRVEDVDADLLVAYLKARGAFLSKSSVASVISTLRNFGEYMVECGVWAKNPLRWMRGPKLDPRSHLPRRVSKAQLLEVFREAAVSREAYYRYLMLAILSVLYSTGIRRGELERLRVDDYDLQAGTLSIDGRKTGRERVVPLAPSTVQCIEAYLPQRFNLLCKLDRTSERSLFVGKGGYALRGESIGIAVGRLARRAGVPHVTLHQFRHSCASDLLEEGIGMTEVQRILGHSAIVTTFRYTQVADPDRTKAIALHPINEMLQPTEVIYE